MPADLEGLTVVSVEQAVAAPYASAQLAQAGARVIKVERPEGDFARRYDRHVREQSAYFVWLNAGKESVCLDLTLDGDRALLRALANSADVFLQNLKPGVLARWGLDSGGLRGARPELITCDISGFGQTGPYAGVKAYDLIVQAEAGLCAITGNPGLPARVGISLCDIAAGAAAHAAILQALFARSRTGLGRGIEVSLFDSLAHWMAVPLLQHLYGGQALTPAGVSHPTIAPYGAFACRDGAQVIFSVQNAPEWRAFAAKVMGVPEMADDPHFRDNSARVANRRSLDAAVAERFGRLTFEEAAARLSEAGIAFGRLNSLAEAAQHPHLRLVSISTPQGEVRVVAPAAIATDAAPFAGRVPACGEHTDRVRAQFEAASREIAP